MSTLRSLTVRYDVPPSEFKGVWNRQPKSLKLEDGTPNSDVIVTRIAQISDDIIDENIGLKLIESIKFLQKTVTNYRLGSLLGRGDGIIHDLIDSSLNCNWYNNDLLFKQRFEKKRNDDYIEKLNFKNDLKTGKIKHCFRCDSDDHMSSECPWYNTPNPQETNKLNPKFIPYPHEMWIPTEYHLKKNKFVSKINNLSYNIYGTTLYPLIETVFTAMLPMFEWIIDYKISEMHTNYSCQVIVKMQDYILKQNQVYQGNYHKEGIDEENIIAVGIYYFDISSTIKSGNLDFQTVVSMACGNKTTETFSIKNIQTGSCVVFSNIKNNFHKVGEIRGYGSRKILSFFLIDPKQPIKSSKDIVVNWDDVTMDVINYWKRKELKGLDEQLMDNINDDIYQILFYYVVGDKNNLDTLRSKRMKMRTPQLGGITRMVMD